MNTSFFERFFEVFGAIETFSEGGEVVYCVDVCVARCFARFLGRVLRVELSGRKRTEKISCNLFFLFFFFVIFFSVFFFLWESRS